MKSVTTIVCALLMMLTLIPDNGLAQSDEDINTRVENLVRKHYMDGIPYAVANALGPAALPYLFKLLINPDDKPFWVNIIVTIGFIEDSSAVEPLIAFLEDTRGEVDSFTFRALLSVPYALGCIAASGDAGAFQFLAGNLDERPDQTLGWSFRGKPVSDLIAEQSVMGLAVSGRPEARTLLINLQAETAQKAAQKTHTLLGGNVDQGLAIMDRIDAKGRAAILNPRRGN